MAPRRTSPFSFFLSISSPYGMDSQTFMLQGFVSFMNMDAPDQYFRLLQFHGSPWDSRAKNYLQKLCQNLTYTGRNNTYQGPRMHLFDRKPRALGAEKQHQEQTVQDLLSLKYLTSLIKLVSKPCYKEDLGYYNIICSPSQFGVPFRILDPLPLLIT